MSDTFLVVGGTGKTGRRVAARLAAAGHGVRAVSRSSSPAFDWTDPTGWAAALDGVTAAYVTFVPDLAAPGADDVITAFLDVARAAGVRRVVLLSGRGESGAQRCEKIVLDSGLEATVVRAAWFAQNFTEGHLHGAVLDGVVAMPAGSVAEPFVDVDDIAAVAVAALTGPAAEHAGRVHEVTGPRALTFHEVADLLTAAAGRPVGYLPITLEQFREGTAAALGPEASDLLTALCAEVFDGRNEHVTDGVEQVLGRPPRDLADVLAEAAREGAWTA